MGLPIRSSRTNVEKRLEKRQDGLYGELHPPFDGWRGGAHRRLDPRGPHNIVDGHEAVFKEAEKLAICCRGWIASGRSSMCSDFRMTAINTADFLMDILLWLCDC